MNVSDIISAKGNAVRTIDRSSTLCDAIRVLGQHNIGAVVVTGGEGPCCGILSERDIVRRLSGGKEPGEELRIKVEDCMTTEVYTCTSATNIEDIMGLMTERRIRHVPVIDEGELTGIVSIGDVVKLKIEAVEQEAESLRGYIAMA